MNSADNSDTQELQKEIENGHERHGNGLAEHTKLMLNMDNIGLVPAQPSKDLKRK